ncbi:hypothetical protein PACTADRAFT_39707 [Pachysolen tannophilus NRRL Y-2460]|uniref:Major facilitator superfamily (MFS) profile domain-containing protein n=1 Tax=Pachysolen tannophilus NRRL Y-2460 TaxID=669874 RepID=A0A1E4TZ74_PACTA|nr:hypothetical protein PACTADRAFT_39707 [Pachysolen tannophilus NRRL Y-2460]
MEKETGEVSVKPVLTDEISGKEGTNGLSEAPVVHLKKWRWKSPEVQMMWCSFLVACTAGLYVAINGLRNNGKINSSTYTQNTDISTAIGNAVWVLSSLVAGATLNSLGPRWSMAIGALGYPMYISGFWFYGSVGTEGAKYWIFLVSGLGAGLLFGFLWAVQNYLVNCYAKENEKGLYVALNWSIIKSGAVVGSLIGLCLSTNATSNSEAAPWYLYLIFICINVVAIFGSFFLCDPSEVRRSDNSKVAVFKKRTLKEELIVLKNALMERRIQLMILPLFCAEVSLAPCSSANAFIFNVRTKSLNNLCYWIVQIPGAFILHKILDRKGVPRKTRAYWGLLYIYVFITATFLGFYIMYGAWGGEAAFSKSLSSDEYPDIDWTEKRYAGPFIWYLCCGVSFGALLNYRLWLIGAMSNDPKVLGTYSGLVPAFQAAGIALAFGIASTTISYTSMFAIWWVLLMVSLPCMFLVIKYYVTDTNYFKEDDVYVPAEYIEQLKVNET